MITSNTSYPDILTIDEVCDYLNLSKSTCLNLLREGKIKGFKINKGRAWRVYKPLLDQYIRTARKNNYHY